MNGVTKGIIKQFLGYVPIMVKSKLCNLYNLPPQVLIEHHEEAEVSAGSRLWGSIEGWGQRQGDRKLDHWCPVCTVHDSTTVC